MQITPVTSVFNKCLVIMASKAMLKSYDLCKYKSGSIWVDSPTINSAISNLYGQGKSKFLHCKCTEDK